MKLGTSNIVSLNLGSQPVSKVMLGASEVWSADIGAMLSEDGTAQLYEDGSPQLSE